LWWVVWSYDIIYLCRWSLLVVWSIGKRVLLIFFLFHSLLNLANEFILFFFFETYEFNQFYSRCFKHTVTFNCQLYIHIAMLSIWQFLE
jgi:hypothetical protein